MPASPATLYAPLYWPTWLMLGALWCVSRLPWSWQLATGRAIGRLALHLGRRRRRIAATNLALCFPQLGKRDRQQLLSAHFSSLGIAVVECALAWWAPERRLAPLATLTGLEHLHEALQRGRGVILLSAHFTTLEIGGRLLAQQAPFHVLYRQHKNPVMERVMTRARTRLYEKAIPRHDAGALLQSLKQNRAVWYAPDQDHGIANSVFVPFFGVPAATLTTTSRLASLSGAAVVPFFPRRLPGRDGYTLELLPALADFPGDDATADAERILQLIESRIRLQPEQYLWVHRRFKTRPEGEPPLYTA